MEIGRKKGVSPPVRGCVKRVWKILNKVDARASLFRNPSGIGAGVTVVFRGLSDATSSVIQGGSVAEGREGYSEFRGSGWPNSCEC